MIRLSGIADFLRTRPWLWILGLSLVAFFPGLGSVHLFDWDEINFAEVAREMIVTGNYTQVQIDFAPFYEKPPLFFWLQVLSMRLFGINEFAARFPNALFGVLTLLTLYRIGSSVRNAQFGCLWALMYVSALLPHFYFKTGIIDPVFNYFIFLGIYSLSRLSGVSSSQKSVYWALLGGSSIGLAILTKGPVGWLIPVLTWVIYWTMNRFKPIWALSNLFILGLIAAIIPLVWVGYETYQNGLTFIQAFIQYQIELFNQPVAGHGQPFYYHFLVLLVGCFPASILALGSLFRPNFSGKKAFYSWMQILFWVVMMLFSWVTTKIVHYSSMAYFPVTFLAAHYLCDLDTQGKWPSRAMRWAFRSMGLLVVGLLMSIPLVGLFKEALYSWVGDDFTRAILAMPVPWSQVDLLVGVGYGLGLIVADRLLRKKAIRQFAWLASLVTTFCLSLGTLLIVPKIEAHIQKPAIDFYQQLASQDVYVTTIGFKSYAPLFYFQQPHDGQPKRKNPPWLLTGQIDKPAYLVVKVTDQATLETLPHIRLIKTEGGFAFYKRDPGS